MNAGSSISLMPLASGFPVRASTLAPRVDHVFLAALLISVVVTLGLLALNLSFLIRYRRGRQVDRSPRRLPEAKIEAAWITATTLGFLGFFWWGARIYVDEERPPARAYTIDVIGRQWMWDIRQPNGRREFNTLHVPAGQDVRLRLSSEDVIHSFFVPAFRVKQDAVPGRQVSLWFNADRPGTYPFFCTQYCGTKHSAMIGQVVVQPPEAFAQWLEQPEGGTEPMVRGRALFVKYNCAGCHDQPSSIHAPPLDHVFGNQIPLDGGRFVRADAAYLRDSILEPTKDVVAGYQPIMPSYKGIIPEGDLLDLIDYLEALARSPENSKP